MSRAFIKNDAADEPAVVPPRAPLPPGVQNYVTPRGLALLHAEHANLEAERARLLAEQDEPPERNRRLALISGSIAELNLRIAKAKLVDSTAQPRDSVRFGATVTLTTLAGSEPVGIRRFTIVGVDEAAAGEGRLAFTAPLARALLGRVVDEQLDFETAQGNETLRIDAIEYGE